MLAFELKEQIEALEAEAAADTNDTERDSKNTVEEAVESGDDEREFGLRRLGDADFDNPEFQAYGGTGGRGGVWTVGWGGRQGGG